MDTAASQPDSERSAGSAGSESRSRLTLGLATLNELTAPQLREEWRRLHRSQPPRLSRDLLVRMIAYRMQELAHGGLSKATRRQLLALRKGRESDGSAMLVSGPRLKTGARLVREWRGNTHTVTVAEDGFEYRGRAYSSLTKVAWAITGAHWSGPRFFGLNRTDPAARSEALETGEDTNA